ncbi:hypothetical protein [Algicola sagamiensis]|uniref:hypothetical protein n=1 Tax=Algicola sagamiensis TaxID=163869 RepID=UPI00035EB2E4|nr:hypothetical protein [Algicola sagamiensis]
MITKVGCFLVLLSASLTVDDVLISSEPAFIYPNGLTVPVAFKEESGDCFIIFSAQSFKLTSVVLTPKNRVCSLTTTIIQGEKISLSLPIQRGFKKSNRFTYLAPGVKLQYKF